MNLLGVLKRKLLMAWRRVIHGFEIVISFRDSTVKPTVLLSEMSKQNSWNNHLVLWDPGVTPNAADKFAHLVSHEDCQRIFTSFWSSMDWDQRKIYVIGLADMVDVKRKRSELNRRQHSVKYHLRKGETKF